MRNTKLARLWDIPGRDSSRPFTFMSSKKVALEQLIVEMEHNLDLPLTGEANLVFGEGDIDAQVMFIGEAPGLREDNLGRPFVGASGKLLDKMLKTIGWSRENVYITNIVKRRPPENRDPMPQEINAYSPYLTRQIEFINPKIIATLGRFSMNYFLPEAKISRDHGQAVKINERTLFPLYHPAAALRAGTVKKELEKDFKKLALLLKKTK